MQTRAAPAKKKKQNEIKTPLASTAKTANKKSKKPKMISDYEDEDEAQVVEAIVPEVNDAFVNKMFKTLEDPCINEEGVPIYGIKGKKQRMQIPDFIRCWNNQITVSLETIEIGSSSAYPNGLLYDAISIKKFGKNQGHMVGKRELSKIIKPNQQLQLTIESAKYITYFLSQALAKYEKASEEYKNK